MKGVLERSRTGKQRQVILRGIKEMGYFGDVGDVVRRKGVEKDEEKITREYK